MEDRPVCGELFAPLSAHGSLSSEEPARVMGTANGGLGSMRLERATARLRAEPAAVGAARALLDKTLAQAGVEKNRRFEALLVASELVTNAVEHGSRPGDEISVDITVTQALMRIAVRDAARARTVPLALTHDEQRSTGRGLALVDWLSVWSERIIDGRREVCAELALD